MQEFKEKGGFQISLEMKNAALESEIEPIPPAEKMFVFLRQHMGQETKPLVKVGDKVKYGQKIGDLSDKDQLFAPIHSPVTGEVLEIKKIEHPESGKEEMAIIIKTESAAKGEALNPLDLDGASREALLERVQATGIVGLGGAAYPTHTKLASPNITHLIINVKESDPNIACDYRMMVEKPREVVEGIKIMAKILGATQIIFATRTEAGSLPDIEAQLKAQGIEIAHVKPCYSIGSEKLLVSDILGKEIPAGKFPPAEGIVVQNIATAYAVYDAVCNGEPLVSRAMTFYSKTDGGRNLWVRTGTPISHILKHLDISPAKFDRIIFGSILMGPTIISQKCPVLKATSGISCYTPGEPDPYANSLPCIRCNYCNIVCPVDIYPQLIMEAVERGKIQWVKKLHVEVCIDCGLCSYVCPSRIKFTPFLRSGKKMVRK